MEDDKDDTSGDNRKPPAACSHRDSKDSAYSSAVELSDSQEHGDSQELGDSQGLGNSHGVKDPPCLDVDGSSSDDDEEMVESPLKVNFAVVEGEYLSEEDFVCFHCDGDVCEFVEYRKQIDAKADKVRNDPTMTASTKRK